MTESFTMAESLNCDSNGTKCDSNVTMSSGNVSPCVGNLTANTHKDKALCDRQNSEILTRLQSSGTPSKTGATETRDTGTEYDPLWNPTNTRVPSTKPSYVVIDTNTCPDVTNVRSNSDVVVVVKPSSEPEQPAGGKVRASGTSRCCRYLKLLLAVVCVCVPTSILSNVYVAPIFTPDRKVPVSEEVGPRAPLAEKLTGSTSNNDESHSRDFHWATFYMDQQKLDQQKLEQGKHRLPWKLVEDGTTGADDAGIKLTDTGCFRVPKTSVYEVYSRITFEFTINNDIGPGVSIYHNINRIRNGEPDLLDKNRFSAPYRPEEFKGALYETSSLIVFSEFQAGDSICVHVGPNTSFVYESETDNTVKIIQRGD